MPPLLGAALALFLSIYASAGACDGCHAEIAARYRHVSMSQSLQPVAQAESIEDFTQNNHFFHAPSNRHYKMIRREGRLFQQRYVLNASGRQQHLFEREITHIIGSGRHARSYLHLASNGELTQLPVTWYTQEERWAMSPGYDNPSHQDFSRTVDSGCLFCHAAYPLRPAQSMDRALWPDGIPTAIDCQRCHGPGASHIRLATSRAPASAVRKAIVNPKRLPVSLQQDICLQCHLQTTSDPLPHALRRLNRTTYSFVPGEPVSAYAIHFDHAPGIGKKDKFEINSHGYRLSQSACFQKGQLTCTTCHNPHGPGVLDRNQSCRGCHAAHPEPSWADCVSCHMPRRRTEDAIHVVMTDHRIQRQPETRDLIAPLTERPLDSRLVPILYPPDARPDDIHLGVALVARRENLLAGAALLRKVLGPNGPQEAALALARAEDKLGNGPAARALYERILAARPAWTEARTAYAESLFNARKPAQAAAHYERVVATPAPPAQAYLDLARIHLQAGRLAQAIPLLKQAATRAPVRAEALSNLGAALTAAGQFEEARRILDDALAFQPFFADAHNNSGRLLAATGDLSQALAAFERAAALDPQFSEAHFNAGRLLHATGRRAEAMRSYREALRLSPNLVEARISLGVAFGEEGQFDAAIAEFEQALRLAPGHPDARRNLSEAMRLKKER